MGLKQFGRNFECNYHPRAEIPYRIIALLVTFDIAAST